MPPQTALGRILVQRRFASPPIGGLLVLPSYTNDHWAIGPYQCVNWIRISKAFIVESILHLSYLGGLYSGLHLWDSCVLFFKMKWNSIHHFDYCRFSLSTIWPNHQWPIFNVVLNAAFRPKPLMCKSNNCHKYRIIWIKFLMLLLFWTPQELHTPSIGAGDLIRRIMASFLFGFKWRVRLYYKQLGQSWQLILTVSGITPLRKLGVFLGECKARASNEGWGDCRIIWSLFTVESPNYTRISMPTQSVDTTDSTTSATSGRHLWKFEKTVENAASDGFGSNLSGATFCLGPANWWAFVTYLYDIQRTLEFWRVKFSIRQLIRWQT